MSPGGALAEGKRTQRINTITQWNWSRWEGRPQRREGVMQGPRGPQHKPKRASEQGTVPTRASAKSLLTVSDGKSFQLSSTVSWKRLFFLPGVRKVNRASATLGSGTWCHQELLHIWWNLNCVNFWVINSLNVVEHSRQKLLVWLFSWEKVEFQGMIRTCLRVNVSICGFG